MKALAVIDRVMVRFSWLPNWTLFAALLIAAYQVSDRDRPFELLHVYPSEAQAGQEIVIYSDAWRDLSRPCSVDVTRAMYDASGKRWTFPPSSFGADSISAAHARTPDRFVLTFEIPATASAGRAEFISNVKYHCNKIHAIWPIEYSLHFPFTVLE